MAENDEFGAFLIGFIIGGLTGAAVSLLMAPQTGEETRGYLRERAIELREKAAETAQTTYSQVGHTATEIADRARTSAEDLQRRSQVALDEQRSRITDRVQNLRRRGENEVGMGDEPL